MSCASGLSHIVQAGDTLFMIAEHYMLDGNLWSEIKNPDGTSPDPNQLHLGQELCCPRYYAVIYDDAQYQGFAQGLDRGSYDWGQIHNDTISSLRMNDNVSGKVAVTLYSDTHFQGKSKIFTADTPYVGNDFNDITSSIKVETSSFPPP